VLEENFLGNFAEMTSVARVENRFVILLCHLKSVLD
jgi:hypothetical protein